MNASTPRAHQNSVRRPRSTRSKISAISAAIAATILIMVGSLSFTALPASAASGTPGDFSSLIPNVSVTTGWVDDCYVETGVVVDTVKFPDYADIGGTRVNCWSVHPWFEASVGLWWSTSPNGPWTMASSNYGVRYNQSGTGYALNLSILRTGRICGRGFYWAVTSTVRTERSSPRSFQQAAGYQSSGCKTT